MNIHNILKNIHDNAWVLSLIILICILVTIPLTITAVENKTAQNTQAATLACVPYPPCYYSSSRCALPQTPSTGKTWCPPAEPSKSCGTIVLQGNSLATASSNQNAESCFWNAYQQCNTSTNQSGGTTLSVVQTNNNTTMTTMYTTKRTTTNGIPTCSIAYKTSDTSTCTGVTYSAQTGLQFNSCDSIGSVTIPPLNPPTVPSTITTPTPACTPRPACLDATPQCEIAMPVNGWCPTTPTPTVTTNKTCQTSADCATNQICVAPGPIRIDPTTGKSISVKYCYNKGTAIPL